MRIRIIIVLLIRASIVFSQECSCEEKIRWLVRSFETNDVDFPMLKQQIGDENYNNMVKRLVENAINLTDANECYTILNQYLKFLRPDNNSVNEIVISIPPSQYFFSDTIIECKIEDFKSDTFNMVSPYYEGIWETNGYKIGIKKINDTYLGIIINSDFDTWKKGQVKLQIKKDKLGNYNVLYSNRF